MVSAGQFLDLGASARQAVAAVLFDLDGTLVDTMPIHYAAYRDVLAEFDIPLAFDDFIARSGGAARETIPRLIGDRPCPVPVEEIHKRKVARANVLFSEQKPDALPTAMLIDVMRQAYPIGLVSSGSRNSVTTTLRAMGWTQTFRVIITGDDVEKGKPAPEGYLKAARALDVAPDACLVFEDMDDGVSAARAAGMQVYDTRQAIPAWRRTGAGA